MDMYHPGMAEIVTERIKTIQEKNTKQSKSGFIGFTAEHALQTCMGLSLALAQQIWLWTYSLSAFDFAAVNPHHPSKDCLCKTRLQQSKPCQSSIRILTQNIMIKHCAIICCIKTSLVQNICSIAFRHMNEDHWRSELSDWQSPSALITIETYNLWAFLPTHIQSRCV